MRIRLLLVLALVAGCVTPDAHSPTPETNVTSPTGDASMPNGTMSMPPMGERMAVATEPFLLMSDHTMTVVPRDAQPIPEATVAETARATAFYESFASGLELTPWTGPPSRSAWETTADLDITVKFKTNAPAVGTNPSPAGFPAVGGWFGTTERAAFFVLATDAPQTLEANKVYTVHLVATPPKGGFFLREGEHLALTTFLSYQVADGSAPMYVVGGDEPAGFALVHEHFNLTAPTATVLYDKSGEVGPNPGFTGDMQQTPVDVPFKVPPDALFVVLEITGAPKAGTRVDLDVGARTAGGDVIASGSSPEATEMVVLGPGNLAAYGRDLVARVTSSSNPSGATFALKITSYAP
ncbi:MAG TPA: hypothetical protein VM370_08845 [Candidatus Thermoplasmatota archaeon]|nr:hypothetical protein [Candidatus Thermoplasmatota archaeon]